VTEVRQSIHISSGEKICSTLFPIFHGHIRGFIVRYQANGMNASFRRCYPVLQISSTDSRPPPLLFFFFATILRVKSRHTSSADRFLRTPPLATFLLMSLVFFVGLISPGLKILSGSSQLEQSVTHVQHKKLSQTTFELGEHECSGDLRRTYSMPCKCRKILDRPMIYRTALLCLS
jgi:hypothetical protein